MFNFAEIGAMFLSENALIQVKDANSLASKITGLLQNAEERNQMGERALQVMSRNRGALSRQIQMLEQVLAG